VEVYAIYLGDTSRFWTCYDHHQDADWPVCIELLKGIAKAFRKGQTGAGRRACIPARVTDETLRKAVLSKIASSPPVPNRDAYRTIVVMLGELYPCKKMDMSMTISEEVIRVTAPSDS